MRTLLVEESFAYGFTIAFWGSGMVLVNEYGFLDVVGVLGYVTGTVTGFGLLALLTFGGAVNAVEFGSSPRYFVLSGIHYIAGAVPIVSTYLLVESVPNETVAVFLSGVCVAVLYNASAALEEVVSETLWRLERG